MSGLSSKALSFGSPENKLKYNGKEEQKAEFSDGSGLDWLDYGARMYDNQVGRWSVVDPLAEKMYNWSIYKALLDNPIIYIDPNGQTEGDFYDREGNYLGTDGQDDGKIYLLKEGWVPKKENTNVNWGGKLQEVYSQELKKKSEELEGLVIQTRVEEGSDYTISELKTVGGKKNVTGFILEPSGPSTPTPNQDKRIPEGVYDIDSYSSAKFPDNFLLSNKDVSKDRRILYHAGNNGSNTEGCNMPGSEKGDGMIKGSKAKMQELRTFLKTEGVDKVKTIIVNRIKSIK